MLGSSAPLRLRLETHPRARPLTARRRPGAAAVRRAYEMMGDPVDDPAYVETVLASWARPGAAEAFVPLLRQVVGLRGARISPEAAELRRIDVPVRLVWVVSDTFASPAVGRRAASLPPRGELFCVRGGHLPWLTSPGDVAQLVREAPPAPVKAARGA